MRRTRLIAARLKSGWSQDEAAGRLDIRKNTYQRWEMGQSTPYPYHALKLCELFGVVAEELDLVQGQIETLQLGPTDDILESFATGITASAQVAEHGGRSEMQLASQIAGTYMPVLQNILKTSSKHRLQAAALVSKLLQVQQGSAYHLEGLARSVVYAEESLKFARLSEDAVDIVVALHHLATLYEWPLPGASVVASRKKGLALLEEAAHVQEKTRANVPPVVQAWAYIGLAKFQALCALKQEAHATIGKANDAYARGGDSQPGLYFNETNLIRQQAIAHSYLNEQTQAVSTFLRLLDVNDEQIAATMTMPARTHLSVVSETVFSLLKLPTPRKDRDLTVKLWFNELQEAQSMKSTTYLKEAETTLGIMECVWSDDTEVLSLRDALYA
jgi:DNA-binding XRE family transcriptional regulator